ncbi:ABC transporter permease [Archangium lansingense]|uniref:ABC3 transporter permease C-terminal domain-containing protein n=1 Tax=Archangium lansingense TaxID=2995310 RepID=A0ABT4ALF3_9BACT|nr:ABC transporter permease [Archangium lansinium]MCY1082531.1 hypothetical protein [Archangium lansinium]
MSPQRLVWLAVSSLRYRWLRSLLAVATVSAAVATILVTRELTVRPTERAAGLFAQFESRYLLVYDSYTTSFESRELDAHQEALATLGVTGRHDFLLTAFIDERDPVPLVLCSFPQPAPPEMAELYMLREGRAPRPGERTAMVERNLADRRGLTPGSALPLFRGSPPFTVVGLFERRPEVVTADVYVPLSVLQEEQGREGELSFSLLELKAGLRAPEHEQRVAAVLPEWHVSSLSTARARADAASAPLRLIARTLTVLVGTLSALIALLTLWGMVSERSAEFAVMRTLGFSRLAIAGEVLCEGALLGVLGAMNGGFVGQLILLTIVPAAHPGLGGWLPPVELTLAMVAGVVTAMLGALGPGLRAGSVPPAQLMRP